MSAPQEPEPIALAEPAPEAGNNSKPVDVVDASGEPAATTQQPQSQTAQMHEKIVENENAKLMGKLCAPGYQTPFFGCLEDMNGCFLSCCCFHCVAAQVKADLDGRPCTIWDCCFFPWAYQNRQQLRSKFGYEYAGGNDCVAQMCCVCCMINQEVREFALRNGTAPRYFSTPTI